MTAQEKAIEICQKIALVTRFSDFNEGKTLPLEIAKKLALICVNEMIEQNHELFLFKFSSNEELSRYVKKDAFLFDVKKEIEKL